MSTTRHRDRGKEEFWRRQVREWRQAGLSVRDFCRRRCLSEPSFYAWRRMLPRRDAEAARAGKGVAGARASVVPNSAAVTARNSAKVAAQAMPAFVPVRVAAAVGAAPRPCAAQADLGLELLLANGRCLRVGAAFDAATLQRLLAILEASAEGPSCS